MINTPRH